MTIFDLSTVGLLFLLYRLVNKANKAMYEVLKKGRLHNLSVKCQYDLFDKIVNPILLYGCEIWGFSNIELLVIENHFS
jgi:hypothetical protein